MMQRVFHIVLALKMLISTTGIGIIVHYCQTEGTLTSFFTSPECVCESSEDKEGEIASCCSADADACENESEPSDCCDEEFKFVQNDIEYLRAGYESATEVVDDHTLFFDFSNDRINGEWAESLVLYPPPKSPRLTKTLWIEYNALLC